MLKWIAIALFAVGIGLAALAREGSSSFQQCEAQNEAERAKQQNIESPSFIFERIISPRCTASFINSHNAVITAISTVLLFVVTGGLVWIGYRQIVTTRAQLRAYVSVRSFGKSPMADPGLHQMVGWELSLVWQNTGATPTRDMLSHVSVYFEPNDLPEDFRFPDTWIIGRKQAYAPVFLAPNSTFIDGISAFSVAQLQEVRAGQKFLYLYGWADYNDVFPGTPRHRTEFCARVMLPGDPAFPGEGNVTFDFHWKHNGADDECMRKPTTSVVRERIPDFPA